MSPGGLAKKLLAFVGIVLLIQLGLVAWMLAAPRVGPVTDEPTVDEAGARRASGGPGVPVPACSTAGNLLTCPGAGQTLTWGAGLSSVPYANVYGDGSDGNVTADGTSTVTCLGAPSSSVYTLTRDCYFENLTVNTGVSVYSGGFRVFVSSLLTLAGAIQSNGTNAVGGDGGASGGVGGTGGNYLGTQSTRLGFGGNGGSAGTSGNSYSYRVGGQGGSETALNTNGTAPPAYLGAPRDLLVAQSGLLFGLNNGNPTWAAFNGGAGGASGGSPSGGGGGGGVVIVSAYQIAGSGTISANGGNGAQGNTSGNQWWGGGGGGGVAVVVYHVATGWTGSPPQANQGSGTNNPEAGNGIPLGAGVDGGFGFVLVIQV